MKNTIRVFLLMVLMAIIGVALVSCGNDKVKGTDVILDGYTEIEDPSLGTICYKSVPNSKLLYSLSEDVTVNKKSTWTVSTDIDGKNVIPSKTLELSEGNNIFFLMVEDNKSNVKQYTLVIKRNPIHTVTYYQDTGVVNSVEFVEDGEYATPPELTAPRGYHLYGWSYDFSNPITSNVDAKAIWAQNEYKITYDYNGVTGNTSTQTVKFNSEYTLPSASRPGYTFLGWYNGSVKITSGRWGYTTDLNLKAQWSADRYVITYYLNGGNNNPGNVESYYTGDEVIISAPTKEGYEFLGWTYSGMSTPTKNVTIKSGEYGNKYFTANWSANSYNVVLNPNSGVCDVEKITATYNTYVILPKCEKTGYTFLGWYNGSERVSNGYWNIASDVELLAKWEPTKYFITYNLSDGTNSELNPTFFTIESLGFSLYDPQREGYEFLGWTYEGQNEPTKIVTIEGGSIGNRTFTAQWKAKSFSISFDPNGGECVDAAMDVTYDELYALPTPTREGHTFSGWYYDNKRFDSGVCKISDNITLTAKWDIIDYKISYVLNGGDNASENPTWYNIITGAVIENPTRVGYTFIGWTYDGQDEPKKDLAFDIGTKGDITLVAHWSANQYTVTLLTDGGTVESNTLFVVYDSSFSLPNPAKSGYSFDGWYYGENRVMDGKWKIAKDVTLNARWSIINYTISYSLDGGVNNTNNPASYNVANAVSIKNPTRTGYTFLGWTCEGVETPTTDLSISVGTTGNKILTAHWSANEYTVTLDANGGECGVKNKNVTFDEVYNLPVPTRDGYTFVGWYNGSTKYNGGTWKNTNNVSLVAEWKANTYKITYNANGGNVDDVYQDVTFGMDAVLLTPTRVGYTFLGWYNGETKVENGVWNYVDNLLLTAKWKANTYTVLYDANGGNASHTGDTATYDSDFTLATIKRDGYTFLGWYDGNTLYESGTWSTASNVILVARWSANTDTKYIVNHHKQNIDDSGYTIDITENLKGTSDTIVTPAVKSFDGFTSPSAKTVTVLPDGSLVVNYYYTRNSYTITFVTNGGSAVSSQTYKYGESLNLPTTSRKGVTFGGWFTSHMLVTRFSYTTMPEGDKTLYAWWQEENKPTDFTYTGVETITISSYVGTSTTMWIPAYIKGIPVMTIPASAFENKAELVKVFVPDTVTSIGLGAFKGCESIEDITLPFLGARMDATEYDAVFGYIFGYDIQSSGSLYRSSTVDYPELALGFVNQMYSGETTGVNQFSKERKQKYDANKSANIIYYLLYYYVDYYIYNIPTSIKNVTITNQTGIPVAAFNNCDFIETVNLPDMVENIDDYAFQNCNATINYFSTEE